MCRYATTFDDIYNSIPIYKRHLLQLDKNMKTCTYTQYWFYDIYIYIYMNERDVADATYQSLAYAD